MKKLFWWMLRRPGTAAHLELAGSEPILWCEDGYSLLELERAGLSEQMARSLGLPIDPARPSAVGSNVVFLGEVAKAEPGQYL